MAADLKVNTSAKKILNLGALQRIDPKIWDIVDDFSHVVAYNFVPSKRVWEKSDIEGPAFVTPFSFMILNKNGPDNLNINLSDIINIEQVDQYIMLRYKTAGAPTIVGIWCHNEKERDSMHESILKTMEKVKNSDSGDVNNQAMNNSNSENKGNNQGKGGDVAGKTNALKSLLSVPVSDQGAGVSETKNQASDGTKALKDLLAHKIGNTSNTSNTNTTNRNATNGGKKLLGLLGSGKNANNTTAAVRKAGVDSMDLLTDRDIAGKFNGKSAGGPVQQNGHGSMDRDGIPTKATLDLPTVLQNQQNSRDGNNNNNNKSSNSKNETSSIPSHHLQDGGVAGQSSFFDTQVPVTSAVNDNGSGGRKLLGLLGGGNRNGTSSASSGTGRVKPAPAAKAITGGHGFMGSLHSTLSSPMAQEPAKRVGSFLSPSDLLKMA